MPLPPSQLDAADPLAGFADEFYKPEGQIYLDGNSLGLLCRPAEAALREALESWRSRAVLGWTAGPEPWFEMSRKAAGLLAPLLGAEPADVMVGQSTTVNLHQLLATYWNPDRPNILIDEWAFPSDRYAVESLSSQSSVEVRVVPDDGRLINEDRLVAAMTPDVGLAVLPAVQYRTGQLLDLVGIARRARGVTIAWDCSHSVGVVPHRFRDDGIGLAFGCTYKYLNGGPGAVGWLYASPYHRDRNPGLAGWFGSDPTKQFAMASEFHPAGDAGRFLIGTPHVLSLAPLLGSLGLVNQAGITAIREKSLRQTSYLRDLVELRLARRFGVKVVTPRDDRQRGGHLTLAHPAAGNLSRALRARGVIPDFRPPDLLRLAPSPLYTSFAECAVAIAVLEDILTTNAHEHLTEPPDRVT
jgi:kynureninase